MRFGKTTMVLAAGLLWASGFCSEAVSAGSAGTGRLADMGNLNIDLAVRKVTVTPIRAHVGDVIRIDVLIENKAEGGSATESDPRFGKDKLGG